LRHATRTVPALVARRSGIQSEFSAGGTAGEDRGALGDIRGPGSADAVLELREEGRGVPPKRAQEIHGHADVRTTLAIYNHAMRRKHDDSADKMAETAGLTKLGNNRLRKV
jgi:hypothetical protein